MQKVMSEGFRRGSRDGEFASRSVRREVHQKLRHLDENMDVDLDNRSSIKGHLYLHKRDRKETSVNYNPLRRFLFSNIGRPWNDVYSEIRQGFKADTDINKDINYHLKWMVETEIKMKNGVPYVFVGSRWRSGPDSNGYCPLNSYYTRHTFYVNPDNGLLCLAPKYERPKKEYPKDCVQDPEDKLHRWHMIDGIWYEFHFRNPTDEEKAHRSWGYLFNSYDIANQKIGKRWHNIPENLYKKSYLGWDEAMREFGSRIFPIKKRQISSKEIKRVKALMEKAK